MGRWGDAGTRRITNSQSQCPMPHAPCPSLKCSMFHFLCLVVG
ncbi:hypothetical protein [Nostoc linckia]|nr:hypothetical protein [Nostoc linckia]